ncbi:hypothetical protein [Nostoc sp. PCC 7107]|uniref:hypothetical protein n=1 Tax=Nostoc sp. PCC 7107 TaxID=317936 RepID=UPI00029F4886|nr:hypothetical protein [Nostoc sp. PCC 7107]AFY42929.1 hypothetical protein Nos7107_2318 [Nostoc sp. PCC 7107]
MIKYHSLKVKSAELKVLLAVAGRLAHAELKDHPQEVEYQTQNRKIPPTQAGTFIERESTKYFVPDSALSEKLRMGGSPVEQTSVTQNSVLSKVNWLVVEE